MYFVEIHWKRSYVPLIQYVNTEQDARRLFDAASPSWVLRRFGKDGQVIQEEKRA